MKKRISKILLILFSISLLTVIVFVSETTIPNTTVYGAKKEVTRYTIANRIMRPSKNSTQTLGVLSRGTRITGIQEGAWFRFTYNGQTAYTTSAYLTTEKPVNRYTLANRIVRPYKTSTEILGVLSRGTRITGVQEGAWFKFVYNGKIAYTTNNYLTAENPVKKVYILANTPIFNRKSGNIIDRTSRAFYVEGFKSGNWLEFKNKHSTNFIAYSRTQTTAPTSRSTIYLLAEARVYNSANNQIVRKTRPFEKVYGREIGEYIYFRENGKSLKVRSSDAIDSPENSAKFTISNSLNTKRDGLYKTSKGFIVERRNGISKIEGTIIANKSFSVPKSYSPGLSSSANSAFNQMKRAMASQGLSIWKVSDYRSYQTQQASYQKYLNMYGRYLADTISARPGHSEHQLGLAFDINSLYNSFAHTAQGKWLARNAWKYGFALRYPSGKQSITGYAFEPWHYRYVGVDLARKLYNGGNWLTIEEYYGIPSHY